MRTLRNIVVVIACSVYMSGQPRHAPTHSEIYAGSDNPLVRMGVERVWKGIDYPLWFQYPNIPIDIRQQIVDDFTTREILASLERSYNDAPATKYTTAAQLIFDLLSAYGGNGGSLTSTPTKADINQTLKNGLLPKLVKPREGRDLDSPSDNETTSDKQSDYDLPSGDEIKLLDHEIAYVARKNNIPQGYVPPTEKNFAAIWEFQMDTEADSDDINSSSVSVTLRISQTGTKLTAIKAAGGGLIPVGAVSWTATLVGNGGSGVKRMWFEHKGNVTLYTIPITIAVEEANTIKISGSGRDPEGHTIRFRGTGQRSY